MYTVTIFETAADLLDAFVSPDANVPDMPSKAYVVFDGMQCVYLSGVKDLPFDVSENITQSDVIEELFKRAGARVYIT